MTSFKIKRRKIFKLCNGTLVFMEYKHLLLMTKIYAGVTPAKHVAAGPMYLLASPFKNISNNTCKVVFCGGNIRILSLCASILTSETTDFHEKSHEHNAILEYSTDIPVSYIQLKQSVRQARSQWCYL
jgi:hypothetical protein